MNPAAFQQAITASTALLQRIKCGDCADSEAKDGIRKLTSSVESARGFFVALLAGTSDICDHAPPAVIVEALRLNEDISCDLLARNLVMSSATALAHNRKDDLHSSQQSKMVALRASNLIEALGNARVRSELELMNAAIEAVLNDSAATTEERSDWQDGSSKFSEFLIKWKYDREQLAAAHSVIQTLIDKLQ